MKTYKTRSDKRETFTYVEATGEVHTYKAGVDPESGEFISEEWIKILHRMDDNEVYNNVKNTKRPVEEWEKPLIEEWKKAHPYDDLPSRSHVSIDAEGENDEGIDDDSDKGYLGQASLAVVEDEDPMKERLHEVVAMLEPERRLLYHRVIENEESLTVIAEEEGVSVATIHNRIVKIKKFIEKNI